MNHVFGYTDHPYGEAVENKKKRKGSLALVAMLLSNMLRDQSEWLFVSQVFTNADPATRNRTIPFPVAVPAFIPYLVRFHFFLLHRHKAPERALCYHQQL